MKLIDADAIVKFIENGMNNPNRDEAFGSDAAEILAEIMITPTLNPDDCRPHGRWEKYANDRFNGYDAKTGKIKYRKVYTYECDQCGINRAVKSNYCPNCGAKMDGKENE